MSNNTATIDKPMSREKRRQLAREEKAKAAVQEKDRNHMSEEWSTAPDSTPAPSTTPAPEAPVKRGPGRPKGSGKKQSNATPATTPTTTERKKPGPPKGYRKVLEPGTERKKPGPKPKGHQVARTPATISAPVALILAAMYPGVSPEKITAIVYLLEN